jgi:hypothetical protein
MSRENKSDGDGLGSELPSSPPSRRSRTWRYFFYAVAGLTLGGVAAEIVRNTAAVGTTTKGDRTSIEYVDKQGRPISKERAEAWLRTKARLDRELAQASARLKSEEREREDAETLAKGFFAAQVIRCYQMNDIELRLNESLCKDALRRIQE